MTYPVNVRTLAETCFEGGDLTGGLAAIERMQEGLKGHLMLQNAYTKDYRAEVPVKLQIEVNGIDLTVQGRIDGLMLADGECTVEEIKTTRKPPSEVLAGDYPVHWAQAEIYAFIMCRNENLTSCSVRLVYANLSGEKNVFTRSYTCEELESLFFEYSFAYTERLKKEILWLETSLPTVKENGFPFKGWRSGQRQMASLVYKAIRDRTRLLAEAPTGTGKTIATLFPAVKALGEGLCDTIFYLTARTTGRLAAENALRLLRNGGLKIRSVTISAKRKVCPTPDSPCDPRYCERAAGYFDRQKDAVEESWGMSELNEESIAELADKYSLCPFELSLALSETAQIIICDYNYVFDPAVRLRRFFNRSGRYCLLVDEAHNLSARAREMYSAEIGTKELKELRREIGKAEGKDCLLYKSLTAPIKQLGKSEEFELRSELPIKLIESLKPFLDEARPYLGKPRPYSDKLPDVFFAVSAFMRTADDFDEEDCKVMVTPESDGCRVKLWCWDPAARLKKITGKMCGAIMFSATLSPLEHYAKLLSVDERDGGRTLTLASPFPRENLLSLSLEIPTTYSKREESVMRVARALHTLALSKPGNYLACFPSHAYLELVHQAFSMLNPRVRVIKQQREMSDDAREKWLEQFKPSPGESMIGFIAMGGVFSEGIDLPGDRLIGAAIVGVGLPQLCYEREALRSLYNDDEGTGGFETSYVYPGISKCLQAAGRVIRTETDRGAVLFIDERYTKAEYYRLLPPHMACRKTTEARLGEELSKFWNAKG